MIEIIAPSTSERLVDPQRIVDELGVDLTTAEALADEASATIAGYCTRHFGQAEVNQTWRASGFIPYSLISEYWPIVDVTSVVENDIELTAEQWERDTSVFYRLHDDRRAVWVPKIVIRYKGGYELPSGSPPDLQRACLLTASTIYSQRGANPNVRSERLDGVGSVSYRDINKGGGIIPGDAQLILSSYKNMWLSTDAR